MRKNEGYYDHIYGGSLMCQTLIASKLGCGPWPGFVSAAAAFALA